MMWLPTNHPEQVSERKYTHSENICTVCWRKQNGDNMKHLIVASPLTVSTTLLPQKNFTQNPFFTTTNKQGPALLSLLLHLPLSLSACCALPQKEPRVFDAFKTVRLMWGPDDSARHMCRAGERCCVIVWQGC